jgi:hypothetical protein
MEKKFKIKIDWLNIIQIEYNIILLYFCVSIFFIINSPAFYEQLDFFSYHKNKFLD